VIVFYGPNRRSKKRYIIYLLPGIFLSRNIITNETTKTLIAFIGIAITGFINFAAQNYEIFFVWQKSFGKVFFVYKKSFLSLHRKNLHYEIL